MAKRKNTVDEARRKLLEHLKKCIRISRSGSGAIERAIFRAEKLIQLYSIGFPVPQIGFAASCVHSFDVGYNGCLGESILWGRIPELRLAEPFDPDAVGSDNSMIDGWNAAVKELSLKKYRHLFMVP